MMTESQAREAGRVMLHKMRSKGWRVNVWENLGWYCDLTNGLCGISVHYSPEYKERPYWAMMCDGDEINTSIGSCLWDGGQNPHFKDPNKAVVAVIKRACPKIEAYIRGLKNAESIFQ